MRAGGGMPPTKSLGWGDNQVDGVVGMCAVVNETLHTSHQPCFLLIGKWKPGQGGRNGHLSCHYGWGCNWVLVGGE